MVAGAPINESSVQPRLTIAADRAPNATLNAGWWPRSWDAAAELPGLVTALTEHYGPIPPADPQQPPLADRPRAATFAAGTTAIRWFSTAEPSLLVAIIDLVGYQSHAKIAAPVAV